MSSPNDGPDTYAGMWEDTFDLVPERGDDPTGARRDVIEHVINDMGLAHFSQFLVAHETSQLHANALQLLFLHLLDGSTFRFADYCARTSALWPFVNELLTYIDEHSVPDGARAVKLRTWGYGNRSVKALATLMEQYPTLHIIDVRLHPISKRHEWDRKSLEDRFPGRYWWHGDALGNAAQNGKYGPGARPDRGIWTFNQSEQYIVARLLSIRDFLDTQGHEPLFMCAEGKAFDTFDVTRCHRVDVVQLAQERAWRGATIEHLD